MGEEERESVVASPLDTEVSEARKDEIQSSKTLLRWVLGMETRRGRLAISGCPALATDHWSCRVLRGLQKNRDRE